MSISQGVARMAKPKTKQTKKRTKKNQTNKKSTA